MVQPKVGLLISLVRLFSLDSAALSLPIKTFLMDTGKYILLMNDMLATRRQVLVYESYVGMQDFTSKSIWKSVVINRKSQCKLFSVVGPKPFQSMSVTSNTKTLSFYLFIAWVLRRSLPPQAVGNGITSGKLSTVYRCLHCMFYRACVCALGSACVPTRSIPPSGTPGKTISICQCIPLLLWIPKGSRTQTSFCSSAFPWITVILVCFHRHRHGR